MSDASSYWSPVCKIVSQLRCWVRIGSRTGNSTWEGRWGQLLTIPTEGYLEALEGPILLRDVEWVEVSTKRIRGGIAGRPRQMVDIKDDILSALRETQVTWEVRESSWSRERVFEEEPVQVVRILNPFGPTPARLS
jgi:hypothetical protein